MVSQRKAHHLDATTRGPLVWYWPSGRQIRPPNWGAYLLAPDLFEFWRQSAANYTTASATAWSADNG